MAKNDLMQWLGKSVARTTLLFLLGFISLGWLIRGERSPSVIAFALLLALGPACRRALPPKPEVRSGGERRPEG